MPIRILLVDDHQIVLDGIGHVINNQPDMEVIGTARDGHSAITTARQLRPDVIIMDIGIPGLNGIEATRRIIAENEKIRVIGLSVQVDPKFVTEMLQAGAKGYLPKDAHFSELVTALHTVMQNKRYLSPLVTDGVLEDYLGGKRHLKGKDSHTLTSKEVEVLQLIAEGCSSKQIAAKLNISARTADTHRNNILHKLKLGGIAELTKYALRHGFISVDS